MRLKVGWHSSRVRVWIGELPEYPSNAPEVLWERLPAAPGEDARDQRCAAVEMLLPGPEHRYGALGAWFTPDAGDSLLVEVPHATVPGPILQDTLAAGVDVVHQGMLTEYVASVLAGAVASEALRTLGSGTLRFGIAAHGQFGSSGGDFQMLARLVVELLVRPRATDEELARLVQAKIGRGAASE